MSGADARPLVPGAAETAVRYRCRGCGNLTRFDVVATRRTRSFHHYSVGGDLTVEDETVLDARIDGVECRWCGASGDAIEVLTVDLAADVATDPGRP